MGDKTTLKEDFLRSIKFDEKFLKKLDDFLKLNFQKVLYAAETDKHSLCEKVELDSFLSYIKNTKNEKIQKIQISAYKGKELGYREDHLSIDFFGERKLLPNVTYEYKDGLTNSDRGFLVRLNEILKENRFWYAFLFDDGVIPSHGKYMLIFLTQAFLAAGLVPLLFGVKEPLLVLSASFVVVCGLSGYFNYIFPRLVFILTEKEQSQRKRYDLVQKFLLWIISGLFFTILGAWIQKYFLT